MAATRGIEFAETEQLARGRGMKTDIRQASHPESDKYQTRLKVFRRTRYRQAEGRSDFGSQGARVPITKNHKSHAR